MKVIAFITDYAVVNRIIGHLIPFHPKPSFFGVVSLSGDTQARPPFDQWKLEWISASDHEG